MYAKIEDEEHHPLTLLAIGTHRKKLHMIEQSIPSSEQSIEVSHQ